MAGEWRLVEPHLRDVMESFEPENRKHPGNPFVSPYQIAIRFAQLYPEDFDHVRLAIGGRDSDVGHSLSRLISQQLAQHPPDWIQIAFLHSGHLDEVWFTDGQRRIQSSTLGLTMFRMDE